MLIQSATAAFHQLHCQTCTVFVFQLVVQAIVRCHAEACLYALVLYHANNNKLLQLASAIISIKVQRLPGRSPSVALSFHCMQAVHAVLALNGSGWYRSESWPSARVKRRTSWKRTYLGRTTSTLTALLSMVSLTRLPPPLSFQQAHLLPCPRRQISG